jgi:hypothetical protein
MMKSLWASFSSVVDKFDELTLRNQLDNPQNPEVRRFLDNYLVLAFELAAVRHTAPNQRLDAELCSTILLRIDTMNDFLLRYQTENETFEQVIVLREAFHMEQLLASRAELATRLSNEMQCSSQQQSPYAPFSPPYMSSSAILPLPPSAMAIDMTHL